MTSTNGKSALPLKADIRRAIWCRCHMRSRHGPGLPAEHKLLNGLAPQLTSIIDTAVRKDHEAASKRQPKLFFNFRPQRPPRADDFPHAIKNKFQFRRNVLRLFRGHERRKLGRSHKLTSKALIWFA